MSPTKINALFFDTVPGGLGQPLTGPSVTVASKEEVVKLYADWEDDLRIAAEVTPWTRSPSSLKIGHLPSVEYRGNLKVGYQSYARATAVHRWSSRATWRFRKSTTRFVEIYLI